MRLIDANEVLKSCVDEKGNYLGHDAAVVGEAVSAAQTVDAVPVCRCSECKHTKTDGMDDPAIYCKKWDRWEMPSDFYCKYGERKGGDE